MTEQVLRRRAPERLWFRAALVFAAVAVFANLGSEGIYAAQEGRTAIILRNMLRTGDCLEMVVKDGVPYEKPIGHYWLCLPSAYFAKLGGDAMQSKVEWGIRIPSALCSLLTVLLAGLLAKRLYGERVGAMAMAILATMSNYDKLGRLGHIDMPLAAAFMAAMYFLYVGYFETWKANWKIYIFYVALGWGMLLKGPLVLMLAGLVVIGMAATRGKRWYEVFRDLRIVRGALIVLVISLPWYIYECLHSHGEFFDEFIVRQNLNRFTGDPGVYRKKSPVWHYIPKLLAGALPWSIAAVAALIVHFKRIIRFKLSTGSRFLLIWFLTGFVFFSLSAVKRIDYLLPLFPALAVMTARAVEEWCVKAPATSRKWWLTIWCVIAGILLIAFAVNTSGLLVKLGEVIRAGKISFLKDHDGMSLIMFSKYLIARAWMLLTGLAVILALVFAAGFNMEKRRYHRVFGIVTAAVLAGFLAYHLGIEPGTDRMKTVKRPFAEEARKLIGKNDKLIYFADFNTELIYFMDRDNYRHVEWECEQRDPRARKRKKETLSQEYYDEHFATGKTRPLAAAIADLAPVDPAASKVLTFIRLLLDAPRTTPRWLIAPPEAAAELRRIAPGVWHEHFRTIENHQYPAVLLERRAAEQK